MTESSGVSWTEYFSQISSFLVSCERQYGLANSHFCEYATERLSVILQGLDNVTTVIHNAGVPELCHIEDSLRELKTFISRILQLYQDYQGHIDSVSHYTPPIQHSVRCGRPSFVINREQLHYLRSLSFSWVDISRMLMISRMTLYRRRVEYGLVGNSDRAISDQALDQLVQNTITQHPYVGQSFVWGVIRSQGYVVTRDRVRQVLRRCDPIGTALRWGCTAVPRQPYSVPGPNSLWHIDGNHKLIRWRLVCHGGIDGFSRMIVFLKCSNNNRSSTVYQLFLKSVDRFGLPSRVRSDFGGENYLVATHMIRCRGQGRGSMLTGSSTHNQRIERLWVDMYRSVTIVYYRLFYHLENQGLLDVLNEVHLFALHYVYLPWINQSLSCFQNGWNHHGIRTARHHSPQQLFVEGSLRLRTSGLVAMDFFDRVDGNYGISNEDPTPEEHGSVTVPESRFNIQANELQSLQNEVNPLEESDNYGIELYLSTLEQLRLYGYT